MDTKPCLHCGTKKPLDQFIKNKSAKSGIGARCLACEQERTRRKRARPGYAEQERQKNAERMAAYRQTPEGVEWTREINRRSEAKRRENSAYLEAQRLYQIERRKNPEVRKNSKAYMEANRERLYQLRKEWGENNRELLRLAQHRRRARIVSASGTFSLDEWLNLCEHYGHKCLRCGSTTKLLTVDHVVPLIKGGTNDISNIQPLCKSCNSSKRTEIIDYR